MWPHGAYWTVGLSNLLIYKLNRIECENQKSFVFFNNNNSFISTKWSSWYVNIFSSVLMCNKIESELQLNCKSEWNILKERVFHIRMIEIILCFCVLLDCLFVCPGGNQCSCKLTAKQTWIFWWTWTWSWTWSWAYWASLCRTTSFSSGTRTSGTRSSWTCANSACASATTIPSDQARSCRKSDYKESYRPTGKYN